MLDVRYLTASDGIKIAYAVHGSGPPLVFVRGWISDIEGQWRRIPRVRRYLEALGERFTVIRYDMRGNGQSARAVGDRLGADDLALDLEALLDWLDLHDATLWATCYGGVIAARYLRTHPERVSRVVLDGCYARWRDQPGYFPASRLFEWTDRAIRDAAAHHSTNPEPGALDPTRLRVNRDAIDDETLRRLYRLAYTTDFTDDMAAIRVPTLVMSRRDSQVVPFTLARELAGLIPGSRLVGLAGTSHNPWDGDAQEALDTMGAFLGVEFPTLADLLPAPTNVSIVLFTDLEGSTSAAANMGDERARELQRVHDRIVTATVAQKGGTVVKSTGDGILATFPSVSQALLAATQTQLELWAHNLRADAPVSVRIGLDAGEPVAEDGDLYGLVVNSAARICDNAEPGQILVASVVRDLARGKSFDFDDAGEFVLKGIREPVRLYRLAWTEPS